MMGGFLGLGPGIVLFGRLVKAGHGSKLVIAAGTVMLAAAFAGVSTLVAWLALKLEPRP